MELFRVFYKEEPLSTIVEAENENEALRAFKKQVAYENGISKKDYNVKKYEKTIK